MLSTTHQVNDGVKTWRKEEKRNHLFRDMARRERKRMRVGVAVVHVISK